MTSANAVGGLPPNGVTTERMLPDRTVLAGGLAGHNNSFGVIRLVLASTVIFSHAF